MDECDLAQEIMERNMKNTLAQRTAETGVSAETCIECGKKIPEARRQASPGCTRCIQCQTEIEATGRGGVG